jgi:hypothetical protein
VILPVVKEKIYKRHISINYPKKPKLEQEEENNVLAFCFNANNVEAGSSSSCDSPHRPPSPPALPSPIDSWQSPPRRTHSLPASKSGSDIISEDFVVSRGEVDNTGAATVSPMIAAGAKR